MLKTSDPDYYKWNQYFFLKFFEKGLVYRKKASVNWCNKCDTVLANEQVHNGMCWRHTDTEVEIKQLEQWFIKTTNYADELLSDVDKLDWPERIKTMQKNWIGKSFGAEIDFVINGKKWPVFTTRPDTIFGVTFVVVSSQHPKLMELVTKEQKKEVDKFLQKIKSTKQEDMDKLDKEGVFTGSYAVNPMTNEKVPIWVGNFVVADYGSGMVMAVPAHDQRDFEFAKKYKIPMRVVIKPEKAEYTIIEKSLPKDKISKLKDFGEVVIIKEDKNWGKFYMVSVNLNNENKIIDFLEKNLLKSSDDGGAWYADSFNTSNVVVFPNKTFILKNDNDIQDSIKHGLKLGIPKNQLEFELKAFTDYGLLVNSQGFDGLGSDEAKEHIVKALEFKKLGRKTVQYKLRDWLISRQRYWGTPIPMIYCDKCGIVPVAEKDLPIKLPENVRFGQGNPLLGNKEWLSVKCPKCNGKARRETDTMDTFFDSSWYFLRYCDNKNSKLPFDKKKVDYWMSVNQYIGGAEHAVMHLIYARFFTKALSDLGFLRRDLREPFTRLFNQGMLHGNDGAVMSKSRGNVVIPEEVSKDYGIDTARLFLMSIASPDKDTQWSAEGVDGSLRFVRRVMDVIPRIKIAKSSKVFESKINKAIKDVSEDIEIMRYNLAVIKLRKLFEALENEKEVSKKDLESFVKLLSPFCPHLAEELWEKIKGKGFVSLAEWPEYDEKKIDLRLEKAEQDFEKTISDINNILKIISERQGKDVKDIYLYVIPTELDNYNSELLSKRLGKSVKVFKVNDPKKYDPESKAGKAKPGKPAIYVE